MKIGIQYREAHVGDVNVHEDGNTVEFSFSSEEPVQRWFGEEILSHEPGAMNLVRVEAGAAPFLWNHDPDQPLGMVKAAKIAGKIGRGKATYFSTPFAQEKKQQYIEGLRNVSFAYQIDEIKKTREADKDTPAQYTATKYTVYEISHVSVPADFTVGMGRAHDEKTGIEVRVLENEKEKETEEKAQPKITVTETKGAKMTPEEIKAAQEKAVGQERERASAIRNLCEKHQMDSDFTRSLIDGGKTLDDAREAVLSKIATRQTPVAEGAPSAVNVGLTEKEVNNFRFLNIVRALANPGDRKLQEAAKFEREVSEAGSKLRGKGSEGFYVPPEVLAYGRRDLTKGTAADGGDLVATNLVGFIEMLRKKSVVQQAGATVLNGLVGDLAIPKQSGGATAYWVAENNAVTESKQSFGQVAMSPKGLGAFTDISRKLLLQSSIDVENLVRSDLATVIALAVDLAALYGAGASNEPTGISVISTGDGLNTKDFASANAPTFAELVDMESKIAADNADVANMKYIVEPAMRGYLKTAVKFSSTASPIWEPGNQVNGYNALVSNQLTAGDVFFGNWADLMLGFWSGLDMLVDPYTGGTAGTLRVIALQDVDVAVRHPESFCFANADQ